MGNLVGLFSLLVGDFMENLIGLWNGEFVRNLLGILDGALLPLDGGRHGWQFVRLLN